MLTWLGVNHYRYNHYQWPPLPYDTHYQWQSLPDDNHYHWQPLPATTTRFHLARKPLPATTTTWQQLPYDDHYRMTTITIWRPQIHLVRMHLNYFHLLMTGSTILRLNSTHMALAASSYLYLMWRCCYLIPRPQPHVSPHLPWHVYLDVWSHPVKISPR